MHDLIRKIESAFAGVPRGRISLREAHAIDSRLDEGRAPGDAAKYAAARNADVEDDWRDITHDVLACDPSVFSFLDDAGFKFVMPAVMRWSLTPDYADRRNVVEFFIMKLLPEAHEADAVDKVAQQYGLSPQQIAVVAEWLAHYAATHMKYPTELEVAQLSRWKELAG